ncbi:MAG: response regulator transcription factor [Terrimicrobiaceae bacterium]|nr:response regulator transcription factor [Terrimicrobiaceae bacterium]
MPKAQPKRILIADDHEVVRQGVRNLLESLEGITLCAEATNGREAVALCVEHQPDVAILDISMPELNGMEAARQVLKVCPKTKILIFTVHDAERLVYEVVAAGAHGYVLKSDAGRHLGAAVEAVLAGKHYFSSQVSEVLFESFQKKLPHNQPAEEAGPATATAREREIIQLLAEGRSNKEVAAALGISVKTAETHRAAIMRKLGLRSIGELVRYAIRNQIIEP